MNRHDLDLQLKKLQSVIDELENANDCENEHFEAGLDSLHAAMDSLAMPGASND